MEYQHKNLSEIGELLIKMGETLKSREERRLREGETLKEEPETLKRKRGLAKRAAGDIDIKVREFVGELSNLKRSEAEEKLSQLTAKELEAMCKLAEIPFSPKKTRKEELIRKILWHFFDFPSGREVIERLVIREPGEVIEFQEAKAFFDTNREKLLSQHEGKYIAILNGNVIDADEDFSNLAERTYGKYGYRDIYMPKVERKETILNIPAPRLR